MGEKTKEMEEWERQEVNNCVKLFNTLERTEKTACLALINSRQANVATEQLKATVVSKHAESRNVTAALALVGEWQAKWLTLGSIIHMAVTTASANYDLILQVRAQKSILSSIILEIAISLLPEFKIIATAFKAFTVNRDMVKVFGFGEAYRLRVTEAAWGTRFDKKGFPATELLDRRSKDITTAIRGGVSTSANIDEASRSLEASFQAKNQIFRTMLGNTAANLVQVSNLAALFNNDILQYSGTLDLKTVIIKTMNGYGLPYDPTPIGPKIWEELSNQILYDMLRAYCRAYVRRNFDGLDGAQREMIYERFANSYKNNFIHDSKRPYINNDDELKDRWLSPEPDIRVDYHVRPGQRR
jgi:hypothetical protein